MNIKIGSLSRRLRTAVLGHHRTPKTETFEKLCGDGALVFDPKQVNQIDEAAGRVRFIPLTDVTGRTLFERRWLPRPPTPGEAPQLPEEFEITETTVILGGNGWVVTRQGWLVPISVWRSDCYIPNALQQARPQPQHLTKTQRLPGLTLNCMSDWAGQVYGHALWESVYRILLHWELHGSFNGVDQILAPRFAQKLLARFHPEITAAVTGKFVTAGDDAVRFVCEAVRVSPHPVRIQTISPRQVDVLRRHAVYQEPGVGKRVFLDRSNAHGRRLINRDEVLETVRGAGYEVLEAASTPNIFSVFRHATHVVGVHGSDLSDIVFMQPGARVLELTPTDHVLPYFRTAADAAGLECRTLFVDSASHRLRMQGPSSAAIKVDCSALASALND